MKLITTVILTVLICASISAQPERTFTGCRISVRLAATTVLQCERDSLDGKPAELRFPVSEFWFSSQCAVTESPLKKWEVANGKVYDPPFTLIAGEQWRYEHKPYSMCEMVLHRTKQSCLGSDVLNVAKWDRCPIQNVLR